MCYDQIEDSYTMTLVEKQNITTIYKNRIRQKKEKRLSKSTSLVLLFELPFEIIFTFAT